MLKVDHISQGPAAEHLVTMTPQVFTFDTESKGLEFGNLTSLKYTVDLSRRTDHGGLRRNIGRG